MDCKILLLGGHDTTVAGVAPADAQRLVDEARAEMPGALLYVQPGDPNAPQNRVVIDPAAVVGIVAVGAGSGPAPEAAALPDRHRATWTLVDNVLAIGLWEHRVAGWLRGHYAGPCPDKTHPDVVDLADLLGRTPDSISRRLGECAAIAHERQPHVFANPGLGADRAFTTSLVTAWNALDALEPRLRADAFAEARAMATELVWDGDPLP